MLYRILQEIIQNIHKHAEADQVILQYMSEGDGSLHLIIEDNGCGFDSRKITEGLGLKSIRSRVDALKGKLEIDSKIGEGTSFHIKLSET